MYVKENDHFDVAGFGSATLDYVCLVGSIANYNQSIFITDVKFFGGGCVPTALVALQRLGRKSAFVSLLGDDWIGKEIIKDLEHEGIYCDETKLMRDESSPFSFIQVNRKLGERAIAFYPGASRLIRFDESVKELIRRSEILLVDGFTPAEDLKAAKFAHKNRKKVMLDANIILDGTKELLPYIDYLITSKAFLFEYSEVENVSFSLKKVYDDLKPEILVTTLGAEGSAGVIDSEIVYVKTFDDVKVVDTTGAGDVYHGAFLFGIMNKWDIKDIMIFSSAVSSIKCKSYGGRTSIPDYKTTMNFLKERGVEIDKFK